MINCYELYKIERIGKTQMNNSLVHDRFDSDTLEFLPGVLVLGLNNLLAQKKKFLFQKYKMPV